MADTTVKKVDSTRSPHGEKGQQYLASGKSVAMRMWNEEPGEAQDESPHAHEYEVVGYVLEGKAELELEGQMLMLEEGDCWVVPKGARHRYTIRESFRAVEATSPPARMHEQHDGAGN